MIYLKGFSLTKRSHVELCYQRTYAEFKVILMNAEFNKRRICKPTDLQIILSPIVAS